MIDSGCTDRCPIPVLEPVPDPVQVAVEEVGGHIEKVDSIAQDVTDIRKALIDERFVLLDEVARENDWGKTPPKETNSDWDAYQEWLYIKADRAGVAKVEGLKKTPVWTTR
jgi:hypothetical protein